MFLVMSQVDRVEEEAQDDEDSEYGGSSKKKKRGNVTHNYLPNMCKVNTTFQSHPGKKRKAKDNKKRPRGIGNH